MTTSHQYIDKYRIQKKSQVLILGTIHPHDTSLFKIPFYYGNKNSLWNILSDAFPNELKKPINLNGVLNFLELRKIAVTDVIRECRRIKPSALDGDLIPTILNTELLDQIKNSEVTRIYFTSGFGKNNAFKLFYKDLLKLSISTQIRKDRIICLDSEIFGRPILLSILFSPSGASNISISKSKNYLEVSEKYKTSYRPIYDFKVDYYREQFSILNK